MAVLMAVAMVEVAVSYHRHRAVEQIGIDKEGCTEQQSLPQGVKIQDRVHE